MLPSEVNERLTGTGPGTPSGEMLRRYWHPVALSTEVTPCGKPRQLRILNEDLVLFRDDRARPGLVGLHCSHRLTSLAYGRVEDGGIRCPFHGWLYDVEGHCLEQPAEPEGSAFKDRVRHTAYPCQELGGLIFAYMGPPEKQPILPRYEILVREDGTRRCDYYWISSNWLQNVEAGGLDTGHFSYLHMDSWSSAKHRLTEMPKAEIEFAETDYGIWQKSLLPDATRGEIATVFMHVFMPAGLMRVQESRSQRGLIQKFQSWYVPIDDTHTLRFQAGFAPLGPDGGAYEWPEPPPFQQPGPENDYFRDYDGVDTISGIPCDAPGTAIKGFLCQDSMVNESQGAMVDRTQEHLASSDRSIVAMRNIYLQAVADVENGRDPKHILRDPHSNAIVYIGGTDQLERV